jgi:flagellar FliL protein
MAAKAKESEKEPDEQAASPEGGEASASKSRFANLPWKLIAIAAAGLVLVIVAGTAIYMMVGSKEHADVAEAKPAVFVDLPEVLVNLSNTAGERTQYLKVKVVLELANQEMMQQITPVMPRIMDTFQTYLRELRPTDLDGSAGLYRLKEELTRRVNTAIAPNKVNAVLFKEIIVQ